MFSRILWLCVVLLFNIRVATVSAQQFSVLKQIRNNHFILQDGADSIQIRSKQNRVAQIIYFLFPAEEDPIGLDPGLSLDGRWRSINLVNIFKEAEIGAFFSTPFRRNVLTLQPLSEYKKASIVYYDQADLKSLYDQIDKMKPKDIILMAHKETLPRIIEHYSNATFTEKIENQPSDRIFVLERKVSGSATMRVFEYKIR